MLLDVRDLTKTYDRGPRRWPPTRAAQSSTVVLRSINLTVRAGEVLALLGESGAGKTTLLKCILGVERPAQGEIRFLGQNILDLKGVRRREVQRQIGAVFQDPYASLNPLLRIRTILEEPLIAHGIGRDTRRERVAELLEMVALPAGVLERRPEELSGGQRQRVAVARGLALNPRLLLADEPASALDLENQWRLITLLQEINSRFGLAMLIVTHSLALARQLGHTAAVMRNGEIVERGDSRAVLSRPAHPYTRALLSAAGLHRT